MSGQEIGLPDNSERQIAQVGDRYLLFAGDNYYPRGGWDDFHGVFESVEAAKVGHLALFDTWEAQQRRNLSGEMPFEEWSEFNVAKSWDRKHHDGWAEIVRFDGKRFVKIAQWFRKRGVDFDNAEWEIWDDEQAKACII